MSTTATLTSTTAPGKIFGSRAELAEHYESDWHKYNLKRREANMPMLTQEEFTARLEAALALRKEREGREARSGTDHLKDKSASHDKKKTKNNSTETKRVSKRQLRQQERNVGFAGPIASEEPVDMDTAEDLQNDNEEMNEQEAPEIDPKQSLFDKHISTDVKSNIEYMYNKFGFFIPDKEFLIDEEGLIGYCAEKIKLGHTCLYCQKLFRTWRGCQEHMLNSSHAKIRYEAGIDLEEFDVFYDFTADNEEFLKSGLGNHRRRRKQENEVERVDGKEEYVESMDDVGQGDSVMDHDEEWEDVDSEEEMADDNDDGIYAAYQDEIARHGFDITPLGELIFPDGRIVGHRGLSRYYKQRFPPEDNRASVISARKAYGERLLNGRVYDTYTMRTEDGQTNATSNATALQLARVGLCIGAAQGRGGKGILVPASAGSGAMNSFTALSLYRYKAAVKKARREEFRGRRLQQRTSLAM